LSAPTDNQIYALAANQFSPSPGTTLVPLPLKPTQTGLCRFFFLFLFFLDFGLQKEKDLFEGSSNFSLVLHPPIVLTYRVDQQPAPVYACLWPDWCSSCAIPSNGVASVDI